MTLWLRKLWCPRLSVLRISMQTLCQSQVTQKVSSLSEIFCPHPQSSTFPVADKLLSVCSHSREDLIPILKPAINHQGLCFQKPDSTSSPVSLFQKGPSLVRISPGPKNLCNDVCGRWQCGWANQNHPVPYHKKNAFGCTAFPKYRQVSLLGVLVPRGRHLWNLGLFPSLLNEMQSTLQSAFLSELVPETYLHSFSYTYWFWI